MFLKAGYNAERRREREPQSAQRQFDESDVIVRAARTCQMRQVENGSETKLQIHEF